MTFLKCFACWEGMKQCHSGILTVSSANRSYKSSERPATALSVNQARGHFPESDATGKSQTLETGRTAMGWHLPPGSYDIVLCVDFIETTG